MKVEFFFDFACPFCHKAYGILKELQLDKNTKLELDWYPCEAHPRPDDGHPPHSDLCIQGFYFAQDQGIDPWDYVTLAYTGVFKDHVDVEDAKALSHYMKSLLDEESFYKALQANTYDHHVVENNKYAYEDCGVWVLPDFKELSGSARLKAEAGVGVNKAELETFFEPIL